MVRIRRRPPVPCIALPLGVAAVALGGAGSAALATGPRAAAPTLAIPAAPIGALQEADEARAVAWAALHDRFGRLVRSLRRMGGMMEEDRGPVERLRADISAFNRTCPDFVPALAAELQLARWLGDPPAAQAALQQRLASLRPDDLELALSAIRAQADDPATDRETVIRQLRQLHDRFPDDTSVLRELAQRLRDECRFGDVVELLAPRTLDGQADGELRLRLAEAHFADHRFQEAMDTARGIDTGTSTNFRIRSQVEQVITDAESTAPLWEAETAIRAAEAEADDLPRARIETSRGPIIVELFENEAPNTVANFVSLADAGFYDGLRFHRFVPYFMIQGGDPESRGGPGIATGSGGPGFRIPDEHTRPEARKHFRDSLAMAKTADPDTAGSQFYLNHRPTGWLNGRHTVFGRVLEGLDVARALRPDDEIRAVTILRRRDHPYDVVRLEGNEVR
ncbi:MAG: peptidylprolyl isomerase [Phycisphaeraceae bacterium]|nr:peptidylprolyl isomerase [Phycisphaeraceae bacterium]